MPAINRYDDVTDDFRVQIILDRLLELQGCEPEYPGDVEAIEREERAIVDWLECHRYLTLDVLQSNVLTDELVRVLLAVFPDIAEI